VVQLCICLALERHRENHNTGYLRSLNAQRESFGTGSTKHFDFEGRNQEQKGTVGLDAQEKVYSTMRASLSNIGHATAADNNARQAIYEVEVEHLDYAATPRGFSGPCLGHIILKMNCGDGG